VALQATLGGLASLAIAYASYELFEKRFLRLKRLFETAKELTPESPVADSAVGPLRHTGSPHDDTSHDERPGAQPLRGARSRALS